MEITFSSQLILFYFYVQHQFKNRTVSLVLFNSILRTKHKGGEGSKIGDFGRTYFMDGPYKN